MEASLRTASFCRVINFAALRAEEKLWYQGCYQGSAIQDGSQDSDSALQIRSDSGVSAVSCSKLCLAQRSPLAAVSMSGECLCLPSLPEVRLENGNCSHGCSDVTWLACGGRVPFRLRVRSPL
ncbi:hypothetical protein CAPTEDRAFT_217054 [Capitella teleta]|uniref:WSC domain-containing protein n=1 Tax=Capitella teleta TaxID=283909 RepID=R7UXW2_CAPTE|nr:hypothetical protein CAPTEDRAFT_217054 [Capitella teleta]|eukprot:ELU08777.1 hypothetical protein CAPTEDRAFT_217054 [Capitella teleta]